MATFLFDKIVFGPVKSRRLGVSLGINLLPLKKKVCNFDCIYCECGLNSNNDAVVEKLPSRRKVYESLREKLSVMNQNEESPDVITFAGNGEPTVHPEFASIIEDTVKLRDSFFPNAKISVLSNATMLHKQSVVDALLMVDQNILKLDSGNEKIIQNLNQPLKHIPLDTLIEQMQQFNGKLIIQTLFTRGYIKDLYLDNTLDEDILLWIECLKKINPEMVMIYTIERDTPFEGLKKIPVNELKSIADRLNLLGIKTQISG